jgi:anaphase-promoting complex subunit 1
VSSAAQLLSRNLRSSRRSAEDSELLKSIRAALRGSGTEPVSAVHSSNFVNGWTEIEITWNVHTVVLSSGGVMQKQWNFDGEGQPIQWACIGLYQLTTPVDSRSSHRADNDGRTSSSDDSHKSTFGLFTLAQREQEREIERAALCPAVFVFLRSIGKIFLLNGIELTFSLPFIVRKAWAVYPHGVMIQRGLDPTEVEEAELTGDTTLPTIFSITSPFSEAASVGLTAGILGGSDLVPDTLKDEVENTTRPLKSVPATETILWVSHRGPAASDDVLVTVDVEKHQLTIWRYVYIKPKDTPLPLGRSQAHKRNLSAPGFSDMAPFSSLPGRPPALSTTTTMASLATDPSSQWPAPDAGRRTSLTRNDLSVTMDRMVLGGRMDIEAALAPVEHGRMKAAYWMEKLHSQDVPEIE